MKIIVQYSGGKDSQACLIWAAKKYGSNKIIAVFSDTKWENPITYQHLEETTKQLNVELIKLDSIGFEQLTRKKGRFASTMARFCTSELKIQPFIDFLLSINDHVTIIQGIRRQESASRSIMAENCTYFKYYFQPYGHDKKGKPKYYTYRKKEVKEFVSKFIDDIHRPIIDWTAENVMNYILENGQRPNPLYYQGFSRVGCFPCIMCNKRELKLIVDQYPETIEKIKQIEAAVNSTFFSNDEIPKRYHTQSDLKSKKSIATIENVVKYVSEKNQNLDLFEGTEEPKRCMSVFNICE